MNLPKLSNKKDDTSSGKVQSITTARKAAAKAAPAKAKKGEPPKRSAKKPGEPSFPVVWFRTARDYLREVVYELRKVVWPSRKEALGSTAVVLVIVGISAVYLGLIDFILSRMVRLLIG